MSAKTPSHVDHQVGRRIRQARREAKLTQEQLGNMIGLTFQQVQKYEKGVNRVSAGTLYEISQVLDLPISWFFDEDVVKSARRNAMVRCERSFRNYIEKRRQNVSPRAWVELSHITTRWAAENSDVEIRGLTGSSTGTS